MPVWLSHLSQTCVDHTSGGCTGLLLRLIAHLQLGVCQAQNIPEACGGSQEPTLVAA